MDTERGVMSGWYTVWEKEILQCMRLPNCLLLTDICIHTINWCKPIRYNIIASTRSQHLTNDSWQHIYVPQTIICYCIQMFVIVAVFINFPLQFHHVCPERGSHFPQLHSHFHQ